MKTQRNRQELIQAAPMIPRARNATLQLTSGHWSGLARANESEIETPAIEDLMKEHGLLNRALLIYGECESRLNTGREFDPALLAQTAGFVRDFIQGYHEKIEEDYIFTRLEKSGRLTEITSVLRRQHVRGRVVTAQILDLTTAARLKDTANRAELASTLNAFARMYRPHEAREDTGVFPTFKTLLSPNEYESLGRKLERTEHERFGKAGLEGFIAPIEECEKALGIYDLAQYTP
jgi:hemerythrin-like domain-containing protein